MKDAKVEGNVTFELLDNRQEQRDEGSVCYERSRSHFHLMRCFQSTCDGGGEKFLIVVGRSRG